MDWRTEARTHENHKRVGPTKGVDTQPYISGNLWLAITQKFTRCYSIMFYSAGIWRLHYENKPIQTYWKFQH